MKPQYTNQDQIAYLDERRKELEATYCMTPQEQKELRQWVKAGHDIYSNPWYYSDENGWSMNYVQAMRFHADMI